MVVKEGAAIKLDLGCGKHKKEGFIGIDCIKFDNVDMVIKLGNEPLPFEDGSVDEIFASHFIEHLTAVERCQLLNEAYRVMKVGAKMIMIVPHWASSRAYGDPTHQWPPIGEMWFYYLDKKWRDEQAPATDQSNWALGYSCDFETTWGYGIHQQILVRNQEFQQFALNFYREAAQDLHATLTKR